MNATTTQCRSQYQIRESLQTGMGFVVPYAWNDRPGSGIEEDAGTGFEFSSCTFSEAEQGPFFPSCMSPADELFHNGKIRPLQPVAAQFQSVSISEEQLMIAQMQVLEDRAFQSRRPSYIYSSVSAPVSPLNPSLKDVEICDWYPEREGSMLVRRRTPEYEKERGKQETTPGRDQPVALLKNLLMRDQRDSHPVFYRRCRSVSLSRDVFHVDNETFNTEPRCKMKESSESRTSVRGRASASQQSKTPTAGKTHKSKTLKELLQREDMRRPLMSKQEIAARRVESGVNKEIRKKEGRSKLQAGAPELVLTEQWRWNKDRSGAIWARSPKGASPHERHYAAQRQQADRMRKKTFLPYRPGLLGCLGFHTSSPAASFRSTHSHLSNTPRPHPPVVY